MPAVNSTIPTIYNKIEVIIENDLNYLNSAAGITDKFSTKVGEDGIVKLLEKQIQSLEIFKSYATHTTLVRLRVSDMDISLLADIAAGKKVFFITIMPLRKLNTDGEEYFSGAFYCETVDDMSLPTIESNIVNVYGTIPLAEATLVLKSITFKRMQSENHIPFMISGKYPNNTALPTVGAAPLRYFQNTVEPLLNDAYTGITSAAGIQTTAAGSGIMDYSAFPTNSAYRVVTNPASNYKLESRNNFEALNDYFLNYPLITAPYTWVLDDFNFSETRPITTTSTIRLLDMMDIDQWKGLENRIISDFFNGTLPEFANSPEQRMAAYSFMKITEIKRRALYGVDEFFISEHTPLIYVEGMDGKNYSPINWNSTVARVNKMVGTPDGIKLKSMVNPRIKPYYTFMSSEELVNIQLMKNSFFALHPEVVTYSFNNMWVGAIDLNTVIRIKKDSIHDDFHYDIDRIGICYEITYLFSRVEANPPITYNQLEQNDPDVDAYKNAFHLEIRAAFLFKDEKDYRASMAEVTNTYFKNIPRSDNREIIETPRRSSGAPGVHDPLSAASESYLEALNEILNNPNYSIADKIKLTAEALYETDFDYVRGYKNRKVMDCSGFTYYVMRDSGVDPEYPDGTFFQKQHLDELTSVGRVERLDLSNINPTTDIKPGDVIFFKTGRTGYGHTGISIGGGKFIHSSVSRGATIGDLTRYSLTPSYIYRFKGQ